MAAGAKLNFALNHWRRAIETHESNFPDATHFCGDIKALDPAKFPSTDILITSPECKNHSKAKTKNRTAAQSQLWDHNIDAERSRATMWDVPYWAEQHAYEVIIVENVVEAAKWQLFEEWMNAMIKLGYEGRPVFMNSMVAHPTPQSRDRMYWVWWKRGNPAPDLDFSAEGWCLTCECIVAADQVWKPKTKRWPDPLEHWGKYRDQYNYRCPTCTEIVKPFAWPALSAIDWSIPGQRIGDRAEPLKPATMGRIQRGLEKYGHLPPLMIPVDGRDGKDARPATDPLATQTTRLETGVLIQVGGNTFERDSSGYVRATSLYEPTVTQHTGNTTGIAMMPVPFIAELRGGGSDTRPVTDPLSTMTAEGNHHLLTIPPAFFVKNFGKGDDPSMAHPVTSPLGTVTTQDHHSVVTMPMPFLQTYYGTGESKPVLMPVDTLTTHDRHALIQPGEAPSIEDCTFRMLEPHEVQAGMAFPADYIVLGTKRDKVKQLGNAVTPPVMTKILGRCIDSLAA